MTPAGAREPLSAEQRRAVVAEALDWIGTPYHPHARVKGPSGGVDCGMLLIEVFARAGVIDEFDPGPYAQDWMRHRGEELFLSRIAERAHEVPTPQAGDIVMMRYYRTFSHGAIYLGDGRIVHAYLRSRAVCWSRLDEFAERPQRFFEVLQ